MNQSYPICQILYDFGPINYKYVEIPFGEWTGNLGVGITLDRYESGRKQVTRHTCECGKAMLLFWPLLVIVWKLIVFMFRVRFVATQSR
jgi:hypothetical protein